MSSILGLCFAAGDKGIKHEMIGSENSTNAKMVRFKSALGGGS